MPYFEGYIPERSRSILEEIVQKEGGILLNNTNLEGNWFAKLARDEWKIQLEEAQGLLSSFKSANSPEDRTRILKGMLNTAVYLTKLDWSVLHQLFIETVEESLTEEIPDTTTIIPTSYGLRFRSLRRIHHNRVAPREAAIAMQILGFSGEPKTKVSLVREYGISLYVVERSISKTVSIVYEKACALGVDKD